MTVKSEGFRTKCYTTPPPLKYWAMLVAIRAVMERAPYPEVMDSLFEGWLVPESGKRAYT